MKALVFLLMTLGLSGCITSEEMQLAPNIVRIDTTAKGALFTGAAGNVTMQKAAKATLANGYDLFKFQDAQMGHTSQFAGVMTTGNATVSASPYMATATGSSFSTPLYENASEVAVTVVMFHAGDPGAKDAFDARAMIAKLGE